MNKFCILGLPLGALALAGCANHGYKCPKPEACNPVHYNYQSAVADNGWEGWQAGRDRYRKPESGKPEPASAGSVGKRLGGAKIPEGDAVSGPVYTPPQPWRVWLAPYSRGDGTLESGTYVWFTSPGHWTYLGRSWAAPPFASKAPGDAPAGGANMISPVPPSALGFVPGKAKAPKGVLDNIAQPHP